MKARKQLGSIACSLACVFISLSACTKTIDRTQVMVLIDADGQARAQIEDVRIEVRSAEGPAGRSEDASDWPVRHSGDLTPGAGVDWPLELALLPLDGDVSRSYAVTATALDEDGRELLTSRAISGFVRGKTLSLLLYFDAECLHIEQACGAELTCVAGVCVDPHRDPETLPEYAVDEDGIPIIDPLADGGSNAGEGGDSGQAGQGGTSGQAGEGGGGAGGSGGMDVNDRDSSVDAAAGDAGGDPPDPMECPSSLGCDTEPNACALDEDDNPICACPDTHLGPGVGELGCGWTSFNVATGDQHSCARLSNGAIKCWGTNVAGSTGEGEFLVHGDTLASMGDALPYVDLGTSMPAADLISGAYHNCVRFADGRIKCWGENQRGELGLGDTEDRGDEADEMGSALPFVDLGEDEDVVQLAANWLHTCARLRSGRIKCWGNNEFGLLGLGDTEHRGDDPDEMGDNLPNIDLGTEFGAPIIAKDLVVGDFHTCAKLNNDRIKCWGANVFSGDTEPRGDDGDDMGDDLPFVEVGDGLTVIEVVAGGYHICARLSSDEIKCWGDNTYGQLGRGDSVPRGGLPSEMGNNLQPVDLGDLGGDVHVLQLAAGRDHTCARLSDGSAKCWGRNDLGQLGVGDVENRGDNGGEMGDNLERVQLGIGEHAIDIVTQENHTCVIMQDGKISCWGMNDSGQLGFGNTEHRGDDEEELGDALGFVDVGGE